MAQSSKKSEGYSTTKYCCVTCGTATDELSHHYKEGVIKIIHCKQCQNPVDPYIELDDLLVFIDFVLLKLRAHRHVLFNIDKIKYNHIIKLCFAFILANAYIKWFHLKNDQYQSIINHDHNIFFALEYGFYVKLIESFLEYAIRFGFILTISMLEYRQDWTKEKSILLFRALVLSSIGQLFILPLLIWSPDHRDYYDILISYIFTTLCHAQVLNASRLLSPLVSFLSSTTAILLSKFFVLFFPTNYFLTNV
ncbi:unnamed protein product [Rotaria magnacalcarata]|uniref:Protein ARV n=3 Tax=Rotaria magnacalcarata TaxID=392030 RepID=A0A816RV34_9BILA|nr:unnamed protein product [Rotaria magnacalcarata]CAF2077676.1 unnamed protein product [Rotaria magnacalcarata]CAF2082653.1 unnamed protein product [Rotaria magnacalcarata]CAF2116418.1 unnamed protein product [Rotaria magnacalcarata]CAF4016359.1 unnamed protein product [Rotaria magnacalcarata]